MPKGIIRVPEKTVLSSELLGSLKERFPDYELEYYPLKPNYQQSYAKRVDILFRAFEFLVDAYPSPTLTKETLMAHARGNLALYNKNSNSIIELQEELEVFTAKTVDLIAAGWNREGKQAAELLNEAEQYVVMSQGRSDLATLTPMKLGKESKTEYILQLDESLPPCDKEVIEELNQLKSANYPKTPAWLRELAEPDKHYMQAFFCNLKTQPKNLLDDFDTFLVTWSEVLQVRNVNVDLRCIAKKSLPYPVWFEKLPAHYQEMMTELSSEKVSTINKKLAQLRAKLVLNEYEKDLEQITKLPQWYWVLSEHQQYFIEKLLKGKDSVTDAIPFACSRHRSIPVPANLAKHSLYSVTSMGLFHQLYLPVVRSSHIASREGLRHKWPNAVQRRHALSNLLKVLEGATSEQVILFQTLISPLGSEDYIPILSSIIPDFKLNQMARAVLEEGVPVPPALQTNHPLNKAKLVNYTVASDPDVVTFLEVVTPYAAKVPELKRLLEIYNKVLESGYGTATVLEYLCGLGRELFISSLEQLIVLTIGGYSYGSCVSGKDRKAIGIIHADAMFLYFLKYGDWPLFEDTYENRMNFISIVADLYISRHHHEHAGQNAPGADGIKTPYEYFPADIAAEIQKRLGVDTLNNDDLMATNNEIREISKGSAKTEILSPADILVCDLVSRQLGEEKCTQLYNALSWAFNDMTKFETTGWGPTLFMGSSIPQGIREIEAFITSKCTGENNVTRMNGIFKIILARPSENGSRTPATNTVYRIRELLKPTENGTFEDRFNKRLVELNALFDTSSKENATLHETSHGINTVH